MGKPTSITAPGGIVPLYANGAHEIGVKAAAGMHTATVTVSVSTNYSPRPKTAELSFDVPDGGAFELSRNGTFLGKVSGDEITIVVDVTNDRRHRVGPERILA